MPPKTICGYDLTDVRKSLREAIGRRDRRAAQRWAAELVATPGAIGSLWAALWTACETTATGNPSIAILLSQTWTTMIEVAKGVGKEWAQFRNDEKVRRTVAELVERMLDYPRQPVITWPSKEVALYDVSTTTGVSAAASDSPAILSVWSRNHDSIELRHVAGHWIEALERGDIRIALSILLWSLLPTTKIQCGKRGPSPLWFWFSVGAATLKNRGVHQGWLAMHDDIVAAVTDHYKRLSANDRLRIVLFWILQLRASILDREGQGTNNGLWSIKSVTVSDIDLPYKEIAAEIAGGGTVQEVEPPKKAVKTEKTEKQAQQSKMEEKIKVADEQIMALLGIK